MLLFGVEINVYVVFSLKKCCFLNKMLLIKKTTYFTRNCMTDYVHVWYHSPMGQALLLRCRRLRCRPSRPHICKALHKIVEKPFQAKAGLYKSFRRPFEDLLKAFERHRPFRRLSKGI